LNNHSQSGFFPPPSEQKIELPVQQPSTKGNMPHIQFKLVTCLSAVNYGFQMYLFESTVFEGRIKRSMHRLSVRQNEWKRY
jgi:hypothetical protein